MPELSNLSTATPQIHVLYQAPGHELIPPDQVDPSKVGDSRCRRRDSAPEDLTNRAGEIRHPRIAHRGEDDGVHRGASPVLPVPKLH